MATTTTVSSPSGSLLPSLSSSISSDSSYYMDPTTGMRRARPRPYLDAFRAPVDHLSSAKDNNEHIHVSPRTVPLSFQNLTEHERGTSGPYGFPALTIRKSPPSNTSHSGLSLVTSDPANPIPVRQHRRRRRSTDVSLSPSGSAYPVSPGVARTPSVHSLPSPKDDDDDDDDDDLPFPGSLDIGRHLDEMGVPCSKHHHRQSVSSTVSITCSDTDDVMSRLDHLEGDVSASVAMEPVGPRMLLPLVDRCEEMRELISHSANERWTEQVKVEIGDRWESEALPLWTKTGREEMDDKTWLKRSKSLLQGAPGNIDGRLWADFCGMVGWDASFELEDEGSYPESMLGDIKEVDEEQEVREQLGKASIS